MDDDARRLLTAAIGPVVVVLYWKFSKAVEDRIRRMPPSIWRRILLLGRK